MPADAGNGEPPGGDVLRRMRAAPMRDAALAGITATRRLPCRIWQTRTLQEAAEDVPRRSR